MYAILAQLVPPHYPITNSYEMWVAIVLILAQLVMLIRGNAKLNVAAAKVQELHVIVNSRLTELLAETRKAARSEGLIEGAKGGRSDQKADEAEAHAR